MIIKQRNMVVTVEYWKLKRLLIDDVDKKRIDSWGYGV